MSARAVGMCLLVAAALGGCGGGDKKDTATTTETSAPAGRTTAVPPTKVEALKGIPGSGFDPQAIYRQESPGVVTVISYFSTTRALGSGFVIDGKGEIATNAHVVAGEDGGNRHAGEVYVQLADGNQVRASVVGTDPNDDTALLKIDPKGLTLRPLPLGSSSHLVVGQPVSVIGSPFGERQSLSVGVISALDRTIGSLTRFQISGVIQTDAAINQGNSGGPLLDARGRVVGIVSSFSTSGGTNEGVGYGIPIDAVKRSLRQLRARGRVRYAYLGVSTTPLYPQLARRLKLPVAQGAFVQEVAGGGPASDAGIRGGSKRFRFQGQPYREGGDIIVSVGGQTIRRESDVSFALTRYSPGETVTVELVRGGSRRQVQVKLGERP